MKPGVDRLESTAHSSRKPKQVTRYRIHISFHRNSHLRLDNLPGDLFERLPFHKPSLDSQDIRKLKGQARNVEPTHSSDARSGSSRRKRGKTIAKESDIQQASNQPLSSQLDPRFGPIHIDWADREFKDHIEISDPRGHFQEGSRGGMSSTTSRLNPTHTSPQLSAPIAKFLKKSSFSIPEKIDARGSFKTGGTEVEFGIVHLFKDLDEASNAPPLKPNKDPSNAIKEATNEHKLDEEDFPPLERIKGSEGNSRDVSSSSLSTSAAASSASASTSSSQISPNDLFSSEEPITLESDDSGCILAVLAVPALFSASDFLAFVEPALDAISHLRMLRELRPNRCLVLIKFRDPRDAEEFHKIFDGQLFNSMNPNEVAQVVYVTSVTMSYHAKLPYTFPGGNGENGWPIFPASPVSPQDEFVNTSARELILKEKLIQELPTCAVCLERMDESVSGLMTIACQHTFHCNCLSKWSDGRCPVCRYSQSRQISNARRIQGLGGGPSTSDQEDDQEHSPPTCCTVCKTESDLWLCMICGNCGCGRYKEGHAKEHYLQTRHLYSLELETQRVWDYAGDNYIHRLIQNKADGKLVELPSSSSQMSDLNINDPSETNNGSTNGTSSAYQSDKIEAIGLEYSYLLTVQLESQRSFYESQLKDLKSSLSLLQEENDVEKTSRKEVELRNSELSRNIQEITETRKKEDEDKIKNEKKVEKSLELIRHLQNELGNEKSVSRGLMANLERLKENEGKMKAELGELKDQVRDLMTFLSARDTIEKSGEGAGGDVSIGKKKKKK